MMCIKIALLLILLLCIAVPAFGADTVHTFDTVVHYDTTYLYDTTLAVQEQLNEMKSKFLDKALQSLEYSKSSLSFLLTIVTVVLAIIGAISGYALFSYRRVRDRLDKEMDKVSKDTFEVSKIYREVVSRRDQILELTSSAERAAKKAVAPLQTEKAKEKRLSPEKRIEHIVKADAEQSIDEYEKLLFAMEFEGVSKDRIPTSLHKNVGLNYFRLARYEKAVEEFLLYLKAFPNEEEILFNTGYCYDKLNNSKKAVELFKRAAEVDPTDDMAYTNWGTALSKLYDERKDVSLLDEAIEKFKRAVEIDGQNDDAYVGWSTALGNLYVERMDASILEETIEKFKKAIEINDQNDDAYYNWGVTLSNLYYERKDVSLLEETTERFKKAIEINSKNADAHYNLACAESLLENKPEMLKSLKIAIEYDPKLKKMAREDKDKEFEKYRDDPDFIALTKED